MVTTAIPKSWLQSRKMVLLGSHFASGYGRFPGTLRKEAANPSVMHKRPNGQDKLLSKKVNRVGYLGAGGGT